MIESIEQLHEAISSGCWPTYTVKAVDSKHGFVYTIKEVNSSHEREQTLLILEWVPPKEPK